MKRLTTIVTMALVGCFMWAQRSVQDRVFADAFRAELSAMIEIFDHEMPCHMFAYWYAYVDVDGDGTGEIVLSDFGKEYKSAFKYKDGDVRQVSAENVENLDINWRMLKWFFNDRELDANPQYDITLKHRPIFGDNIDIAANRFKVSTEVCSYVDPNKVSTYNRMIFKPHVGETKLVNTRETGKEVVYTFALTDPAMTKKMFRGYASTQASPIIVPKAFLETHTPLQYSRWLHGEKVVKASKDAREMISAYFGGRTIFDTQWLASCEVNERSFYYVVFNPQPEERHVLVSLVCIAEGEGVSVCNNWENLAAGSRTQLTNGESLNDLLFHAPQIMAMMATEAGLELYTRWPSIDGLHYSIMREYMDQFIYVQDDFENLVAS